MHLMARRKTQHCLYRIFSHFRHASPCDINFDTSVIMLLQYGIVLSCVPLSSQMPDKEIENPEINHMIAYAWAI